METQPPPSPRLLDLDINGRHHTVKAMPNQTLLELLRSELALTGAKPGCDLGECGACAVLVDGAPKLSCLLLASSLEGQKIVTVEGLGNSTNPSVVQKAFHLEGAAQCGYCTPGFVIVATALLEKGPSPSEDEIRAALSSNLCRCTGYGPIVAGVKRAMEMKKNG